MKTLAVAVELADVDHVRARRAAIDRQLELLVVHGERGRRLLGELAFHARSSSNLIRDPRERFLAAQQFQSLAQVRRGRAARQRRPQAGPICPKPTPSSVAKALSALPSAAWSQAGSSASRSRRRAKALLEVVFQQAFATLSSSASGRFASTKRACSASPRMVFARFFSTGMALARAARSAVAESAPSRCCRCARTRGASAAHRRPAPGSAR